jgi:hypothetical protein
LEAPAHLLGHHSGRVPLGELTVVSEEVEHWKIRGGASVRPAIPLEVGHTLFCKSLPDLKEES